MKEYQIEQFPKNKKVKNLSSDQKEIREKNKKIKQKTQICNKCLIEQPLCEFYIRDESKDLRRKSCRDCQLKRMEVVEIGKIRFSKKILEKGFRRCTICKEIKHIEAYTNNKKYYGGKSPACYECTYDNYQKFWIKQKEEIGLFYIKQYGLRKGINKFTKKIIANLKLEIEESRKPKYFLDGLEFKTSTDFAKYIKKQYGHPTNQTLGRIYNGKSEEDCKLTEFEMRCKRTKGKVKVTDTITGEVFIFNNSKDDKLIKMFSKSAIIKGIKTGEKTRVTKLSKYKNPCIISRISLT